MRLVLKSNLEILDDQFISHLIDYFPKIVFLNKTNMRRLSQMDKYLQEHVLTGRRKFSARQIVMVGLRNLKFTTDGKEAIIQIDPVAIFPFYTYKVKDLITLVDSGNLDIKGTHIISNLFSYVEENLLKLRQQYEMGLL